MAAPRPHYLSPPVDPARDHVSGPPGAPSSLVEFGDYQCPHCARTHRGILRLRDERLPGQLLYVFRHLPNHRVHPHAEMAAEAAECAGAQGRFWEMHHWLFTHQATLDREWLIAGAADIGLDVSQFTHDLDSHRFAERVQEDQASAEASRAEATPTFFVDGLRYDGPWDAESVLDAIRKPLGWRLRLLARQFAGLSISSGLLMLVAVVVALVWANSPWGDFYSRLWSVDLGIRLSGLNLSLSLREWVNEGLIVIFFLVVALEIRHEVTTGELRTVRRAALPVAAALAGMIVPALIFLLFNRGPVAHGWAVPIGTDTALALGVMAVLGSRVPLSLRVFVAAAAVVDDVGSLLVIALFYTEKLAAGRLLVALALWLLALGLNRARIYRTLPYAIIGVLLWLAVLGSGLHPTLAGVLMAIVIPSRPPPNTGTLLEQSQSLLLSMESPARGEPTPAMHGAVVRALEELVDRLLSPARRLARNMQPWSAYLVLPLFTLANAGIVLQLHDPGLLQPVSLGIFLGLVAGKPFGIFIGAWLATRLGIATKQDEFSWIQLAGAGVLCGIGFTVAFFVADITFKDPATLTLVKTSVLTASVVAGVAGWVILRWAWGSGSSSRSVLA